ncbi:TPA: hypothetical protein ACPD3N_000274 [Pasteurella multocida]
METLTPTFKSLLKAYTNGYPVSVKGTTDKFYISDYDPHDPDEMFYVEQDTNETFAKFFWVNANGEYEGLGNGCYDRPNDIEYIIVNDEYINLEEPIDRAIYRLKQDFDDFKQVHLQKVPEEVIQKVYSAIKLEYLKGNTSTTFILYSLYKARLVAALFKQAGFDYMLLEGCNPTEGPEVWSTEQEKAETNVYQKLTIQWTFRL